MTEPTDECGCPGVYLSKRIRGILNNQIPLYKAHLLFWPVFLLGLAGDLWTKHLVFDWLGSRIPSSYTIFNGFFRFILVENTGAAWGIAAGRRGGLIVVSLIAVVVVFAVFLFVRKHCVLVVFSLALLAAGILGNLYDRIFNDGRVRDFLDFYWGDRHFPAFNMADSMLTIAVCLLAIVTIFGQKEAAEQKTLNPTP